MMPIEIYARASHMIEEALTADSFSDLSIVIQDVSRDTGYSYNFLSDELGSLLHEAETGEEAQDCIEQIIWVAYEHDF